MNEDRPHDADGGLPLSRVVHAVASGGADAWRVHYAGLALQAAGRDAIVLSVGDPDFDTPPAIVDAAVDALRGGNTHYTVTGGVGALAEAVAGVETRRLGRAVSAASVVCAGGAQNVLYAVFRCLLEPGDEAILLAPPYSMFAGVIASTGATPVNVPLEVDNGFALDVDAVARAITPRTRAVLANFPHNPSGSIASPESLAALSALCEARGIWLVSDEAYADLVYDGEFISPGVPGKPHVLVVRSLSKSHAMTGWRVGWVVGTESLARHLRDFLGHVTYGAPGFVQAGAVRALTGQHDEVGAMRRAYRARRDVLVDAVHGINALSISVPPAGIFCMLDVRGTGLDGESFAEALLDQELVSVLPGGTFSQELAGHVRVSLCVPAARLAEAAKRMGRFVSRLERS